MNFENIWISNRHSKFLILKRSTTNPRDQVRYLCVFFKGQLTEKVIKNIGLKSQLVK